MQEYLYIVLYMRVYVCVLCRLQYTHLNARFAISFCLISHSHLAIACVFVFIYSHSHFSEISKQERIINTNGKENKNQQQRQKPVS